jgi:AcrR family transcriptional regulator
LYRYFPNKIAFLRYLVRREVKHMRSRALTIILDSDATNTDMLLREINTFSNHKLVGREIAAFQAKRLAENDALLLSHIPVLLHTSGEGFTA